LQQVKKYIEEQNFSPDEADGEFLKTPLMFSVLYRQFNIVEYLIARDDVHIAKTTSEVIQWHFAPFFMNIRIHFTTFDKPTFSFPSYGVL
jgi:hypothetical protein